MTNLPQEAALLKKLEKSMRVTPEKAFERYLLIKQGKENQLYSLQTVLKIKREHPENWREIMAMDAYGLKGGGKSFERHVLRPVLKGGPIAALGVVCPAVAPAAFGAGFAVAVHEATEGRTPIIAGIDHRGNIAVGPSYNSVAYQQKQQRKM